MASLKHHNPAGLHQSAAFTHAVEVAPGAALLFIGGQNGTDESGAVVGSDALTQTRQALENVRTAVEAAGGDVAGIAKWTILVVGAEQLAAGFSAFQEWWPAEVAPPAITVQVVAGLASHDYLVEIEAVAAIER